jgi:hypothetical protein
VISDERWVGAGFIPALLFGPLERQLVIRKKRTPIHARRESSNIEPYRALILYAFKKSSLDIPD